jgi:hypothetical protein
MSKKNNIPNEKELQKRREPIYILDPKEVRQEKTAEQRMMDWAAEKMRKHESKFDLKWRDWQIITSGVIEPEELNVGAVYKFPDLHWYIYKVKHLYKIVLLSEMKLLFRAEFAKI